MESVRNVELHLLGSICHTAVNVNTIFRPGFSILPFPFIPAYLNKTHISTGQQGVLLSSDCTCHLRPPQMEPL